MSDFGDAIGTVTEGSLLASAVEKQSSDGGSPNKPGTCLNCRTELIGAHCHSCGQKAVIRRTLRAFMHDLVHGALHFEGKIWRTLPLLAFKPGQLTRRYIDGERARFVSPMALFLFSVFLMFAVFQAMGFSTPTTIASPADFGEGIETVSTAAEDKIGDTQARLDALPQGDPRRADAENELKDLQSAREGLETAGTLLAGSDNAQTTFDGTGIKWIDEGLIKKWSDNPGLMLYKMQTNSYKFSWLLIPISIPFVWSLFFWKRRFKAYDHAIFVTYSLAFMSLLFLILSVLGKVGVGLPLLLLAGIFIPPVHIYKQLKYSYELSRIGAFWRTMTLVNMIVFVVLMFLWLLLLLGAF